jgi:hypothetical protein
LRGGLAARMGKGKEYWEVKRIEAWYIYVCKIA